MSTVQLGPATIRYETYGDGPAVLLLAPGGLRASRIETWGNAPWNPIDALRDRFRVVAMDQRNTGTTFDELYAAWRDDVRADHPEASDADWSAVKDNLFGREDYLWSVPDEAVTTIDRPLLVLRGNDEYHPAATSERLAADVPGARLIHTWKQGEAVAAAESEVGAFLDAHAR